MSSDIERLLEASIEYARVKRLLKEMTDELAKSINDCDILRQENRLLELKLQRVSRPRIVALTGG